MSPVPRPPPLPGRRVQKGWHPVELKLLVLALYVAAMLYLGYVGMRRTKTVGDFFLGGRSHRTLDVGLRLRHHLFLRRPLRGLCRQAGLGLRPLHPVDRGRKHGRGLPPGLGGAGPPHPQGHRGARGHDHAGVLRGPLRQPRPAGDVRLHHLRLPCPLLRLGLHGPQLPVRGEPGHPLRLCPVPHGRPHRRLPDDGRVLRPHPHRLHPRNRGDGRRPCSWWSS